MDSQANTRQPEELQDEIAKLKTHFASAMEKWTETYKNQQARIDFLEQQLRSVNATLDATHECVDAHMPEALYWTDGQTLPGMLCAIFEYYGSFEKTAAEETEPDQDGVQKILPQTLMRIEQHRLEALKTAFPAKAIPFVDFQIQAFQVVAAWFETLFDPAKLVRYTPYDEELQRRLKLVDDLEKQLMPAEDESEF
ncbi:MAG: hypothetical protein E6R03_04560 [Hyphomicrobiaceae bacterium]|nr:MAG: hypothetical protein E6R03_04560 [Hyphomicrobiaceae bacterium]